jgi:hypothetical protein
MMARKKISAISPTTAAPTAKPAASVLDSPPVSALVIALAPAMIAIRSNVPPTNRRKSENHQYSDRGARPEITKYFLKHVLIACPKPITVPPD